MAAAAAAAAVSAAAALFPLLASLDSNTHTHTASYINKLTNCVYIEP